jgi:branched-chain amino acid transport system permease protein
MSNNDVSLTTNPQKTTGKGRWGTATSYGVLLAILALWPVFYRSMYMMHVLILCFIYMLASVSLRTITVSGQFPLAHAAFMGIGAYLAGMASKWLGWPGWITIPAGAVGAMVLGVVISYPFARLRALYYAMGSMFFGIGVLNFIAAFGKYTGGYSGLMGIHPIFVGSKVPYYYFFLALSFVSILALYRFEFCRIGTNLKAIAQSHLVASSVGINEGFYRILAVGVGCFFAGLAGAGYAHYNLVISSSSFSFLATLWLVMYVLVGGIESFAGPIVGTLILFLVPELVRDLKAYSPFVSVVVLILVVYLVPKGLVSLPQLLRSRRGRNIDEKKGE